MNQNSAPVAKIVQFANDQHTLPDGSKIIYAENDDKIVLYHKIPLEKGRNYVYHRKTGKIFVNGVEGSNHDKRTMIKLGSYMLEHCEDYELVTLSIFAKGDSK